LHRRDFEQVAVQPKEHRHTERADQHPADYPDSQEYVRGPGENR
jgi:hypothetical protein